MRKDNISETKKGNGSLETIQRKEEMKSKKDGGLLAQLAAREATETEFEKAERDIILNANKLAVENYSEIEDDLEGYLYQSENILKCLVSHIIDKAYSQNLTAGLFSKLCYSLSKKKAEKF